RGHSWLERGVGVRRLQYRLLLMPRALAEHAVKAEPHEQGNQGKNDNDGQRAVLFDLIRNIMRMTPRFQHRQRTKPPLRPIIAAASRPGQRAARSKRLPTHPE